MWDVVGNPEYRFSHNEAHLFMALGKTWNGMDWNGMEWIGLEWNGMEWFGMEWIGMEFYQEHFLFISNLPPLNLTAPEPNLDPDIDQQP